MGLVTGLIKLLGGFIGFLTLPGLVLIAEVIVELFPASIEWGIVRGAFSILQNDWRLDEVKALLTKTKPVASGGGSQ